MFENEVLIREGFAVNRQTACAVAIHEITSLNHKALDNSVELAAFVPNWLSVHSKHSPNNRCENRDGEKLTDNKPVIRTNVHPCKIVCGNT
jgi:hypothetical protein